MLAPLRLFRRLRLPRFALIACACFQLGPSPGGSDVCAAVAGLAWQEFPALPPSAGQSRQPGVASPFVGTHGPVLLVAGGANFPGKMPWDGGAKVWWDDIWVLERSDEHTVAWVSGKAWKLPRRIGYGISVSTPDGVVCVGGSDAERCYADVFLLSWDATSRDVRRASLPALPEPLANMAGALVGQTLFVAGGQHTMKGAVASTVFWSLDLAQRHTPAAFKWSKLPTWPGPARVLPVAAAQGEPGRERFYLFGGRLPQPGRPTQLLTDAYAYDPRTRTWQTLAPVGGGRGVSVMAGTAVAVGTDEILLFGGDRGDRFVELEGHDLAVEELRAQLTTLPESGRPAIERAMAQRLAAKRVLYENHPGFGLEVFSYDVAREAWRVVDRSPVPPQVTTLAVTWGRDIVIPSGEIRPGVRTPAIVRIRPQAR
ncbi:kelch repeat-containing protein [Horticoccus sp. 23ND18S-11]|uniref:kelch repeat-containing protein n=1 Tax=Horticoccus sp. 23ND18S-11 TaxID=3391832 RepID=UPI0039C9466B